MKNFKYNLAIVSIMKYEEPYVEEWVRYHLIVGVKHFYIYDNNEESYMKDVLKPYIEKGIVDLIPMYGDVKMFDAYNNSLWGYRDDCKYIAYIDADEFIVPTQDVQVDTVIEEIFNKYDSPNLGGLGIRWQVYGTGHHKTKPEGLMIENYLYKENGSLDIHVKQVVNPRMVHSWGNPHFPVYKQPQFYTIDEEGNKIRGPFNKGGPRNLLRLNHYFYKSEEEFTKNRIKRGKCDRAVTEEYMEGFIAKQIERMKNSNNEYDDLMLRYVDRIKNFKI
jgi:hypothetical protein